MLLKLLFTKATGIPHTRVSTMVPDEDPITNLENFKKSLKQFLPMNLVLFFSIDKFLFRVLVFKLG